MDIDKSIEEIRKSVGTRFDPEWVEIFLIWSNQGIFREK